MRAVSPPPSPPLGWGAGNPAPSPPSPRARLGAHPGSGRGAQASGSGGALTSLGCPHSGLRRRARLGERCPSVSLRTETRAQPRLSGNAAADADPARGAGRSRGGGRAARCAGLVSPGLLARQVAGPGLAAPLARLGARPLRLALPPPPPRSPAPPYLPPPPTVVDGTSAPFAGLRSPWKFSEERFLGGGGSPHKDAGRAGGRDWLRFTARVPICGLCLRIWTPDLETLPSSASSSVPIVSGRPADRLIRASLTTPTNSRSCMDFSHQPQSHLKGRTLTGLGASCQVLSVLLHLP